MMAGGIEGHVFDYFGCSEFFFFFFFFVHDPTTVKPALSDHRFKRPPAFSDRFFMHGESAIQNDLY